MTTRRVWKIVPEDWCFTVKWLLDCSLKVKCNILMMLKLCPSSLEYRWFIGNRLEWADCGIVRVSWLFSWISFFFQKDQLSFRKLRKGFWFYRRVAVHLKDRTWVLQTPCLWRCSRNWDDGDGRNMPVEPSCGHSECRRCYTPLTIRVTGFW